MGGKLFRPRIFVALDTGEKEEKKEEEDGETDYSIYGFVVVCGKVGKVVGKRRLCRFLLSSLYIGQRRRSVQTTA